MSAGPEGYVTIDRRVEVEKEVSKSRFICALLPVDSQEGARMELETLKKKHCNASHNCSAVITGDDRAYMRMSDDGEPRGTAGRPMLEVLKRSGLTYVMAIVTRYFGGTLLGAGGLSRAYGGVVGSALAFAQRVRVTPAERFLFTVDYSDYAKLQILSADFGAQPKVRFSDKVKAEVAVRATEAERFKIRTAQAFTGADVYKVSGTCIIRENID